MEIAEEVAESCWIDIGFVPTVSRLIWKIESVKVRSMFVQNLILEFEKPVSHVLHIKLVKFDPVQITYYTYYVL